MSQAVAILNLCNALANDHASAASRCRALALIAGVPEIERTNLIDSADALDGLAASVRDDLVTHLLAPFKADTPEWDGLGEVI